MQLEERKVAYPAHYQCSIASSIKLLDRPSVSTPSDTWRQPSAEVPDSGPSQGHMRMIGVCAPPRTVLRYRRTVSEPSITPLLPANLTNGSVMPRQ